MDARYKVDFHCLRNINMLSSTFKTLKYFYNDKASTTLELNELVFYFRLQRNSSDECTYEGR